MVWCRQHPIQSTERETMDPKPNDFHLPLQGEIKLDSLLSMVVAILMTLVSIAGLISPSTLYPADEQRYSFLSNDVINLAIGLPILLGSIWLTRRGTLVGLLLWPGALLYDIYNYIAYVSGLPFRFITIIYLAIVLLSAFIVYDLVRAMDRIAISEKLAGAVPEKLAGWILVLFGVVFVFRAVGMLMDASSGEVALTGGEFGTLIADLVLSAVWIAGGIALLRRRPLGYASGLGLLFAGSMLFIGLIFLLIIGPFLSEEPFILMDVVVVFVMGLVCFIPFGLYVRGVVVTSHPI